VIELVADTSGFGDQERMRRAFIRHLGVNPQSYRERFGLSKPESIKAS
jgi:transcriptional regulator GlxA family with amidase domain